MVDKSTVLQIIGALMKHPQYLSESDKYNLTPNDFYYRFEKYIFAAIDNLYRNGAASIQPIDVENYLNTNESAKLIFKQQNGIEYLQDAVYLSDEINFPYYYKKLKKFNLLEDFKKQGIDTSDWYIEDATNAKAYEVNERFEELEIQDIIEGVRKKVLGIEREYVQNDTTEVQNAWTGIKEILAEAGTTAVIGPPLQGAIFNEVVAGARRGIFLLRSAASGVGKSRSAVSDACYLAFPFHYSSEQGKWVQDGSNEKVMVITTEQTAEEVQKMILAYLTDMNETKFRYGGFTAQETKIIEQALWILEQYQDNFFIVRMPSPTTELLKVIIRENVLMHDIKNVFYDYIHVSPSLLNEFKGCNLRNDEVLLIMSTTLKELAVEQNIFIASATQLNANGDNNANIRNESALAGSRAIINKADIGCILARPTKEELEFLMNEGGISFAPTIVCDIYKVRAGEYNQIRIWSDYNLGTLKKKDLFATDSRMNVVPINNTFNWEVQHTEEETEEYKKVLGVLNGY